MHRRIPHSIVSLALAAALVAVASPDLFAQERGYLGGSAGITFGTETAPFFAGEIGAHVTDDLVVYGSVGRMNNVLPGSVQDALDVASTLLTIATGARWEFSATAPAFFGVGGVRYLLPTGEGARPYVQGGIGFANVSLNIEEVDFGDVTSQLVRAGYLDDDSIAKLAFEFGGGVYVPAGERLFVDVGYRFMKLVDAEDVNVSRAYGAVGVRF
ncbi:MAG: outer membrane protein [Vicinamibacterales bacterium]